MTPTVPKRHHGRRRRRKRRIFLAAIGGVLLLALVVYAIDRFCSDSSSPSSSVSAPDSGDAAVQFK